MSVDVRPARAEDEPRLIELLQQLLTAADTAVGPDDWARIFRELLRQERGAVLVAEDEGGVLGLISLSYNPAMRYGGEYAQVEELVVDEAARGKHAGAALLEAAIAAAEARGCHEMGLYPREETRAFYEKYGFRYVGVELRQRLPRD